MPNINIQLMFTETGWYEARHYKDEARIIVIGPKGPLFRAVLRHELAHRFCNEYSWLDLAKAAATTWLDVATTPAGAELYLVSKLYALYEKVVAKNYTDDLIELMLEDTIGNAIRDVTRANGVRLTHKIQYYLVGEAKGLGKIDVAIARAMNEAVANMAGFGTLEPEVQAVYEAIKDRLPWEVKAMVQVANTEKIETEQIRQAKKGAQE